MRSCSSLVLVKHSTKEVASAHPGSARFADQGRTGGGIGRFQPKRSVRTVRTQRSAIALRSSVSGFTKKHDQRERGKARLSAPSRRTAAHTGRVSISASHALQTTTPLVTSRIDAFAAPGRFHPYVLTGIEV